MRQATPQEVEAFAQRILARTPQRDDCWVCAGQGNVKTPAGKLIRCGECNGLESAWRIEKREEEREKEIERKALTAGRYIRRTRPERGAHHE